MRHPDWQDLAVAWLSANVAGPALVVYPRDQVAIRRHLVGWGIDPSDTINAEFLVVPAASPSEAVERLRQLAPAEAYGLTWDGRRIVGEGP